MAVIRLLVLVAVIVLMLTAAVTLSMSVAVGVGVGVTVSVAGGAAQHPGEPHAKNVRRTFGFGGRRRVGCRRLRRRRLLGRRVRFGLQPRKHPAVHPLRLRLPHLGRQLLRRRPLGGRRFGEPHRRARRRRHRRLGRRLRRRRLR